MTAYLGKPIDECGVPPEKRTHPEYQRMFLKLQNEFESSKVIEICSTHEAGHLIFFRKAGFKQLSFFGPTMTYNSSKPAKDESERYNYFYAAIHAQETIRVQKYEDTFLVKLAKAAAAGEVFNEVLQQYSPIPIEKSSDFDGFDYHCRNALRSEHIHYEPEKRWRDARAEVKKLLNNEIDETEIQNAILEIKEKCLHLR